MTVEGSLNACAIVTGILISVTSLRIDAATRCVNPGGTGGCSSSIQKAINAAAPGDIILIGKGTYTENLVVPKPLTLLGVGNQGEHRDERGDDHRGSRDGEEDGGAPVIRPAVSNPNPCAVSSLCDGQASNIILVQANNVTIRGLTLDGNNPHLTSGIVRGGSDLDARNGIITNHSVGTFDNLHVDHVTVKNVYLRGIYASSGGTFDFHEDTVQNVQGDDDSICLFNFGGAGVMARNRASDCVDALSSNWSRGVQFLDNEISRSGSGVHTDNAGGTGGTADLIEDNTVRECQKDGYGIWVFIPYIDPTVKDNDVRGCAVGLAVFGQGAPTTTVFTGNEVNGEGAASGKSGGRSDSIGVLVSTDNLGYGASNVSARFSDNVIEHFNTGVYVEQNCEMFSSAHPDDCQDRDGRATATLYNNAIEGNRTGANGRPGTLVDARSNWWGCRRGPNQPGCDTAIGTVVYTPWLTKRPKDLEKPHDDTDHDPSEKDRD
jgi:hypothetical protein